MQSGSIHILLNDFEKYPKINEYIFDSNCFISGTSQYIGKPVFMKKIKLNGNNISNNYYEFDFNEILIDYSEEEINFDIIYNNGNIDKLKLEFENINDQYL